MKRTYSELCTLKTFEDRYNYLKLSGSIGNETFGFDRYLNQAFYGRSSEWKRVRNGIILRDLACDLGCEGYDIVDEKIIIHHMNPITEQDIINRNPDILNPEYLICTRMSTHNAIHFGADISSNYKSLVERYAGDTCPWKQHR